MQITIREPGSAITHFIAMMLAIFASVPLLVKSGVDAGDICFLAMGIFIFSMILLYGASATYHAVNVSQNRSYDDFCYDCRLLYTSVPDCIGRQDGDDIIITCMGHCSDGNGYQFILDYMPEMVFFTYLYCSWMGMRICIRQTLGGSLCVGLSLAAGRRYCLYHWRRYLCIETSIV